MPYTINNTSIYSAEELSNKFNVTPATIRNYIRNGQLNGQRVMGRWCVTGEDLAVFVKRFQLGDDV